MSGLPLRRTRCAAAALVAAAALGGCGGGEDADAPARAAASGAGDGGGSAAARSPAVTSAPTRRPPRRLAPLPAGGVRVEPGPFTDRVSTSALRVRAGQRPRLTGRMRNETDVSELLLLELQADFYDRRGRYLASGRTTVEDPEAFHEGALRFSVRAERPAPRAVAAILTVPQLVNE